MNGGHQRVCIIGAGPSGLAAARHLKARGIAYDQYERHHGPGGIWDIENPGTPMYQSAHFISSRNKSAYYGFPMPDHYPDYPSHLLILRYLQDFADSYDLTDSIQFSTAVHSVTRHGEGWLVDTEGTEPQQYSHVICCSGHAWSPNLPEYPGEFKGEAIHSANYQSIEQLTGKRVLVVGGGNSACDIACDAAATSAKAMVSMRRGYHFIPKHLFGKPTDQYVSSTDWLPWRVRQWAYARTLRKLQGDLTHYGLQKPDHKVMESHPVMNSQMIHYLQHGDIEVFDDIERFDGNTVHFRSGRSECVDMIIYTTGFKYEIPYMDRAYFDWNGYKPKLAYTVFNPRYDTLFAAGFTEMNAGGYYIFDEMTSLIADVISVQTNDPSSWKDARKTLLRPQDFSGGLGLVRSERHADYLDMKSFLKACRKLRRNLNWSDPRKYLQSPTVSHISKAI